MRHVPTRTLVSTYWSYAGNLLLHSSRTHAIAHTYVQPCTFPYSNATANIRHIACRDAYADSTPYPDSHAKRYSCAYAYASPNATPHARSQDP